MQRDPTPMGWWELLCCWPASFMSARRSQHKREKRPLFEVAAASLGSLPGGGILFFLFATGFAKRANNSEIGLVHNKLALAMLVAALCAAWVLFFNNAPLALLASVYAHRGHAWRDVTLTGICGLALPLASAISLAGFVNQAAYATHRLVWNPSPGGTRG